MVEVRELPRQELEGMLAAGEDIVEWYRVLQKTGDNIVGEVLRDQGTFYQWNHYPKGDVYGTTTRTVLATINPSWIGIHG